MSPQNARRLQTVLARFDRLAARSHDPARPDYVPSDDPSFSLDEMRVVLESRLELIEKLAR